jgi:hypothetical protein
MKSNIHVIILIFLIFILFPVIFNIVELNNIEHFDGSGSLVNIPENEIINNDMMNNQINDMMNNQINDMMNNQINDMPNNEINGMLNNQFNGMPNNQFNGMPNNQFNGMPNNQFQQFFNPHPFKSKLEDIDNRLKDIQKKIN